MNFIDFTKETKHVSLLELDYFLYLPEEITAYIISFLINPFKILLVNKVFNRLVTDHLVGQVFLQKIEHQLSGCHLQSHLESEINRTADPEEIKTVRTINLPALKFTPIHWLFKTQLTLLDSLPKRILERWEIQTNSIYTLPLIFKVIRIIFDNYKTLKNEEFTAARTRKDNKISIAHQSIQRNIGQNEADLREIISWLISKNFDSFVIKLLDAYPFFCLDLLGLKYHLSNSKEVLQYILSEPSRKQEISLEDLNEIYVGAAMSGQVEVLQLLESERNQEITSKILKEAYIEAAADGKPQVLDYLDKSARRQEITAELRKKAYRLAAKYGEIESLKYLDESIENLEISQDIVRNIYMNAARNKRVSILKYINNSLRKEAILPNTINSSFFEATLINGNEVIEYFLENFPDKIEEQSIFLLLEYKNYLTERVFRILFEKTDIYRNSVRAIKELIKSICWSKKPDSLQLLKYVIEENSFQQLFSLSKNLEKVGEYAVTQAILNENSDILKYLFELKSSENTYLIPKKFILKTLEEALDNMREFFKINFFFLTNFFSKELVARSEEFTSEELGSFFKKVCSLNWDSQKHFLALLQSILDLSHSKEKIPDELIKQAFRGAVCKDQLNIVIYFINCFPDIIDKQVIFDSIFLLDAKKLYKKTWNYLKDVARFN